MTTLGILSWGSPKTLWNTLSALKDFEADKYFTEKYIFFQEINHQDKSIAQHFGYDYLGSTKNVGIADGFKMLVENATSDVFLFLENDWELIEANAVEILKSAEMLIKIGGIDIVRLRHRTNPGHPLWSQQFMGREYDSPPHLLDSLHWTEPDFPEIIRIPSNWYYTSSRFANWTNNPIMFKTRWATKNILPRVTGDIERDLGDWWQQQEYIVAQGQGLFTHNRID